MITEAKDSLSTARWLKEILKENIIDDTDKTAITNAIEILAPYGTEFDADLAEFKNASMIDALWKFITTPDDAPVKGEAFFILRERVRSREEEIAPTPVINAAMGLFDNGPLSDDILVDVVELIDIVSGVFELRSTHSDGAYSNDWLRSKLDGDWRTEAEVAELVDSAREIIKDIISEADALHESADDALNEFVRTIE